LIVRPNLFGISESSDLEILRYLAKLICLPVPISFESSCKSVWNLHKKSYFRKILLQNYHLLSNFSAYFDLFQKKAQHLVDW